MNEDLNTRLARLSPEKRALLELRLKQEMDLKIAPLQRRKQGGAAPLSFAQQRMWYLERLEPNEALYHIPWVVKIQGALNTVALHRALNALLARHESLRTQFICADGELSQHVRDRVEILLPLIDVSAMPETQRITEIHRHVDAAIRRPFDLAGDLLIRAVLLRSAPDEHVLAIVMHHIISDGWSLGILSRELSALYAGYVTGREARLPEAQLQYADYACWQRQQAQTQRMNRHLAYWKRQLAGAPELLELPTFQQRPAVQSYRGAVAHSEFPVELTRALKGLADRENATLFMILLAGFNVLLMRYSNQADVVVGSPIAGRNYAETEGVIGCFVNSLAMRTDLSGNPTFRELLKRVKQVALDAYAHQETPLEKLVEELQPRRCQSHPPLFQVVFALQNMPDEALRLHNLAVTPFPLNWETSKFDMTLFMNEQGGTLKATMEYCTDLFKPSFISRTMGHLETLLARLAGDPEQRIWECPLLPDFEKRQLLMELSNSASCRPVTARIQDIFEARVLESPHASALVCGEAVLTYDELNRRANQLAHYLKKRGVGPDVLVGVCVDRSPELIVALLAIVKAGGAFVPLDSGYPEGRLRCMLEDARVRMILVQEHLRKHFSACEAEMIDVGRVERFAQESEENPACVATPENLAYVMYTSGSSGRPKGVCVSHRGVVRLVADPNYVCLSRDETLIQFAPVSFDASTFEIWGALLNGAKLVLHPEGLTSLKDLGDVLRRHKVTTLWLTAGLFHQMVDEQLDSLRSVRQLLAGGDVLSVPHVRRAAAELGNCRLINGYGPTENTTFTCCHAITMENNRASSIPVGKPIDNTQVYILDRCMNPVPVGVPGELYIGGDGLARGYLNRPDLTAEKFVPHPFKPGARLYRTGDEARFLDDGAIEFLGRRDNQVKIRGFRIELGEVESVLRQEPRIREAVVVARAETSGDKRLVAYVASQDGRALPPGELSAFMKARLPGYMIPGTFVMLESFPLSANGKMDRRALPEPEKTTVTEEACGARPRLPIQIQLLRIWEALLEKKAIGLRDDFFALGGHSLLAAKMVDRIELECGMKIPLSTLFSASTIESLSNYMLTTRSQSAEANVIKVQAGRGRPPFFFLDGDLQGGGFYCANLARQLGVEQPFYTLRPPALAHGMAASIEIQAKRRLKHLRDVKPRGPYLLGGFCIDALIAYEMACQLQREGQTVSLLALVDPPASTFGLRLAADVISGIARCTRLSPETLLSLFRRCLSLQEILDMEPAKRSRYFRERFTRSLARMLTIGRLADGAMARNGREDPADKQQPMDAMTAHLWPAIRYCPARFSGPVSLFLSSELERTSYSQWQWRSRVERMDVYPVPGEHLGLITRHVEILGRELKACIARVTGCAPSGRVSECLLSAS